MTPMPDSVLMARAADGGVNGEAAFAEIVVRYQNVLLNFFLRKGVSLADGEDLAQRTFLRLWRYRDRYEPQAKFTTFLFLLAQQVAIDFFRAEKRRRNLSDGLAAEAAEASEPAGPNAPDAERGAAVRRAVSRLTPGLRDVVELGVFQELPYATVSEILGIPEGTVKSRMFHALKKLKEMFNGREI